MTIFKKILKIISIILYVIAGFFVSSLCGAAFLNLPLPTNIPIEKITIKFIMLGMFGLLAGAAMVLAAAFNGFKKWRTGVGAVLISGTGMTVFLVISTVFMRLDPNFSKFFNQQMLRQQLIEQQKFPHDAFNTFPTNPFDMFSDYVTGTCVILILLALGIFLVMSGKKKNEEQKATP